MNVDIENVINKLWDVRCRRMEDEEEIRDIAFLALNTLKNLKEQLEQKDQELPNTESNEMELLGKLHHNLEKMREVLGFSQTQKVVEPEIQELLSELNRISESLPSNNDKVILMTLSTKLQETESDLRDMYRISATKDVHLTRNGKEIMALTHENTLLLEVILQAPNKEDLLQQLEELKKLPLV